MTQPPDNSAIRNTNFSLLAATNGSGSSSRNYAAGFNLFGLIKRLFRYSAPRNVRDSSPSSYLSVTESFFSQDSPTDTEVNEGESELGPLLVSDNNEDDSPNPKMEDAYSSDPDAFKSSDLIAKKSVKFASPLVHMIDDQLEVPEDFTSDITLQGLLVELDCLLEKINSLDQQG